MAQVLLEPLKTFVASIVDGDQDVGAALLEVEKRVVGMQRIHRHQHPFGSTGSSNAWRAAISPPSSVA
jgi:hypothetical protein